MSSPLRGRTGNDSECMRNGPRENGWGGPARCGCQACIVEVDRLLDEVESYRTGLGAGFGVYTANPHKTLVELGQAQERHHQEHHAREDRLRAALTEIRDSYTLPGTVLRIATAALGDE